MKRGKARWQIGEMIVMGGSLLFMAAVITYGATSYRVNNGTAANINEFGVCEHVSNSSGKDIFVPTNTSNEWSKFYTHVPSGVTVTANSCASAGSVACGGAVNGTCTGTSCGYTGTGFNSGQCAGAGSVSCGVTVTDNCGNSCHYTGMGYNPGQCPSADSVSCGVEAADSCGNPCGYVGTNGCASDCSYVADGAIEGGGIFREHTGLSSDQCLGDIGSYDAPCGYYNDDGTCDVIMGGCGAEGGYDGSYHAVECAVR